MKSKLKLVFPVIFPIILFLFPLLKMNQGIDLTDTGYSLGNYRFFGQTGGVWMLLTFLSNVLGHLFTLLPFGQTMLGMKLYTSLLISMTALLGYRFFKTKMPAGLAFAGEMAAIGMCWCPSAILYNYLTYLLFLLGAVFLFRGLAGNRPRCLVIAGIFLGLNTFVRFPGNILECGLILALWYYGAIKKKPLKEIGRETGLCLVGFVGAVLVMLIVLVTAYGMGAPADMIGGVFGIAGSASDYTLGEMFLAICSAYLHGFGWLLYMLLCVLPGIPFLVIFRNRFQNICKIIYCICIAFLFFILGKWGMYNFRYFQKEAALQWGAVFLLIALAVTVWMLFTRMLDHEWRLIGCISLLMILITPLGSNNHIWPVLNNLFFVAPVLFWMTYKFARWGRTYLDVTRKVPLFPVKAMLSAIMLAFLVQAIGIGCFYVFLDGENGDKRSTAVEGNRVLDGMHTTELNAETLEEISGFMTENKAEYFGKKVLLYGNIPGIAYYLDMPSALNSTWADLDSYTLQDMTEEIQQLSALDTEQSPLVIVTPAVAAFLEKNDEAMNYWGTPIDEYTADPKMKLLETYLTHSKTHNQVFANEAFVVYQPANDQ